MSLTNDVYEYIKANPGCTGIEIANVFPVENPTYGRQRATSQAIANLRRAGKVSDCPRCATCGGALSRNQRNVPLYVVK